MVWIAVKLWYG